ncbi:hypothetical protein [Sneathiella sp.]|uniref:hypothetical protein n=1 Tax=Sneathiella sp. TaxID=1964365 RepID=UPI00356A617C
MTILYTLLFALAGALLYRLRGAPWLDFLHRPIKQMLYCGGWGAVGYLLVPEWWFVLLAYVASVGAVSLGHGSYMDLGHTVKPQDIDERPVGWILKPFAKMVGIDPTTTLYDAIGLTLNGILMTLPFAILFWWHGDLAAGFVIFAAGASKTLAYYIGWSQYHRLSFGKRSPGPTEIGEWLTGAFQWLAFATVYLMGAS